MDSRTCRRSLVAAVSAGLTGGCLGVLDRRKEYAPDGDDRTELSVDDESGRICMRNDSVFATFDSESDETAAGVHAFGFREGVDLTGPVETNPVTPESTLSSARLEYRRTRDLEVTRGGGRVGQFRVRREYRLNETLVGVDWTVSLPAGESFLLCAVRIENRDDDSIVLNHSNGDTHDGIMLLRTIGLEGRRSSAPDYRFATDTRDATGFDEQPLWRSIPGIRRVTVFDDEVGITCGYLEGDTGPKFAVLRRESIDLMVNEIRLGAGDAITYRIVVAAHSGDEGPRRGSELHDRARNWERYG